jgi:hypothetical protein
VSAGSTITRSAVDEHIWFATSGGRFAGTVNQHTTAFHVADAHGRYIGAFASLEVARDELTRSLRPVRA